MYATLVTLAALGAAPPAAARPPAAVAALLDAALTPDGPAADDAEFLRRATLDLTGRVPTAARVRAFLASPDRARLIDELLDSPEHARHFARLWARLIAAEEPPQRPLLEGWLTPRFAANRPWGETVTALLTATGKGPDTGFVLSNVENKAPQASKMAGSAVRLFLGAQLQCAECHKHPFTSWTQDDFWGVAAFFGNTKMANKGPTPGVAEVPTPPKGKARVTGAAIVVPNTAGKGAGKVVPATFPGGGRPSLGDDQPHRPALAAWLTARDNAPFARAAANRLWSQLFGRGLVNPVDDLHDDNPATHPAALAALADEFAASGGDLRHLIRCVCASKAYGRTSRGAEDVDGYGRMAVKVMTPDALYDSLCLALGVKDLPVAESAGVGSGRGGTKAAGKTAPRERFLKAFNTADPETTPVEFTHGIPQALSLLNEPVMSGGGTLAASLAKKPADDAVEELFLSALSRRPTDAERQRVLEFVKGRPKGYAEVLWALINSPEFVLIP